MMVRAIICCAALVFGLLAPLGATAQSAGVCNGPGCRAAEKSRPLDLMAFMRGGAQSSSKTATRSTTAKTGKHRHGTSRSATRPAPDKAPAAAPDPTPDLASELAPDLPPDLASLPQQAALPVAAAASYAAHAENDVQVVTSDQVNTIDLAMLRSSPETVGATPKKNTDAGDRLAATAADPGQVGDAIADPANAAASPGKDASQSDTTLRDESWMGRIWSAVGDGFVTLVAMVRQLFA